MKVLPDPVCPYANSDPLNPQSALSTWRWPTVSKTFACEQSSESKMPSNVNVLPCLPDILCTNVVSDVTSKGLSPAAPESLSPSLPLPPPPPPPSGKNDALPSPPSPPSLVGVELALTPSGR